MNHHILLKVFDLGNSKPMFGSAKVVLILLQLTTFVEVVVSG